MTNKSPAITYRHLCRYVFFPLSCAPCISAAETLSFAPEFNSGIGSADKPSSVSPEFNSGKVFINAHPETNSLMDTIG